MKAFIIQPDGNRVYIEPQYGKKFTLEEMQQFVGGYIEVVGKVKENDGTTYILYGDEDGLPKRLLVNEPASYMLGYRVVGNIVFCPKKLFTF